jgi:hypothetical protein
MDCAQDSPFKHGLASPQLRNYMLSSRRLRGECSGGQADPVASESKWWTTNDFDSAFSRLRKRVEEAESVVLEGRGVAHPRGCRWVGIFDPAGGHDRTLPRYCCAEAQSDALFWLLILDLFLTTNLGHHPKSDVRHCRQLCEVP